VRDCGPNEARYHQGDNVAGILFIISAPSGSGKSTLVNQLRSLVSDIDFSVSYTTRSPRGSEQPGREYNYTSPEKFQEMVDRDEFRDGPPLVDRRGSSRQGSAARH
jgi:guanylate kinase